MKYPVGILRNTTTSRFHPLLFRHTNGFESNTSHKKENLLNFSAWGHHINGFETIEAAQGFVFSHGDYLYHPEFLEDWDGSKDPQYEIELRRELFNS